MPLPTFTEEDYKAAEKEILGKGNNKKVKKSENAGKVRSLHHIDDDDDFADLDGDLSLESVIEEENEDEEDEDDE